jgi:hypothetical protein
MTTGLIEAREKIELCRSRPTAGRFQFQRKRVALMPKQQIARAGKHAHALEMRGLAYVARAAICGMEKQYLRMGAQA